MDKLLLIGLFYFIMISLTFVSPFAVRIYIFIANALLPDPLPYADEFLMGVGVVSKVMFVRKIYKPLIIVLIIGLIILAFTYK